MCRLYSCVSVVSLGKSLPLGPLIGGICGGSLTLLLIVIIVVLYVRQRKLKRRLYVLPCNITGYVDKPSVYRLYLCLSSNHYKEGPSLQWRGRIEIKVLAHQVPVSSRVATLNSFKNVTFDVGGLVHTKFAQNININSRYTIGGQAKLELSFFIYAYTCLNNIFAVTMKLF